MSDTGDRQGDMGDARTPLDQALDLLFYAPIGLALNAEEMVNQLAVRGRQSVAAAKFIGRMALHQGRTEVDKAFERLQDQAATLIDQFGQAATDVRPGPADLPTTEPMVDSAETQAVDRDTRIAVETSVAEVNLIIPDYDSLAASQVVPRLAGLIVDELETVRRYEAAHRGRTTVLNRIAQLERP